MRTLIPLLLVAAMTLRGHGQKTESPSPPPTSTPTPKSVDARFVAMSPAVLRPDSDYDISVAILKPEVRIKVTALIYDASKRVDLVSGHGYFTNAQPEILKLKIPMELSATSYKLKLTLIGFEEEVVQEKDIEVKAKSMSLFIQTDKGIYKPGETVKYRAFTVTPDLTPYTGSITVTISDPKKNKIDQLKDLTPVFGVVNSSLELSTEPVLGMWTITVESYGQSNSKQFEVAEYVLPKFEVSVDLPSFLVADAQADDSSHPDLQFNVGAKYTYGQPVVGKAKIIVQIKPYGTYDQGHYSQKIMTKELTAQNNAMLDLTVPFNDLLKLVPAPSYNYNGWRPINDIRNREILVTAEVTETVTGITLTGNDTMKMANMKYKLMFMDICPVNYKPGLVYTGFLQLSQFDGSAPDARDMVGMTCQVTGNYRYPYDSRFGYREAVRWNDTLEIPSNGLMSFSTLIGDDFSSVTFLANCMANKVSAYKSGISKFKSESDAGVQVTLANSDGTIKPNEEATFEVLSTESISGFNYVLLSKGGIVYSSYHDTGVSATKHTVAIPVSPELAHDLAPSARINIWYLTSTGEIITDSLELKVEGAFLNEVSLSFAESEREPGQVNTLSVEARPQSLISLLAVDKSVLLLAGGNDVSENEVLADLKKYDSSKKHGGYIPMPMFRGGMMDKRSIWWPLPSGGSDSSEIFENSGLVVFTDALVYAEPVEDDFDTRFDREGDPAPAPDGPPGGMGPPGEDAVAGDGNREQAEKGDTLPGSADKTPERTRTLFLETWIWGNIELGDNGKTTIEYTVPDTITSWVATAIAMNNEDGLGLSNQATMTTFTPFFVSMNLPYSVIRGEEFSLKCTVFNYLTTDQEVTVTLPVSPNKAFGTRRSINQVEESYETITRKLKVPANGATNAQFWIVPKKLGHIGVKVIAQSASAADAVERKLLVEAEGVEQEYTRPIFINLNGETQDLTSTVTITLPEKELVPDSTFIEITAIGDVMGASINGLESLIKMPYGCGEQNMLNFAPNIYVLQYLEETNQDNLAIKTKAKDFMKKGYQRELNYQRDDGSFSAFGNSDDEGSTWLSAFVVRCFNQARSYITIDSDDIDKTISWILEHQYSDGQFQEPGRVIHSDMQGGASKGLPMTAYSALALLENDNEYMDQEVRQRLKAAVAKTVDYLEEKLQDPLVQKDVYTMAILAYTLQLADSPSKNQALTILENLASPEDGMHLVVDDDDAANPTTGGWRPPYHQAGASNIEATAYLLMNYVARSDILKALDVTKWIVAQRNAHGGFSSTQDTVVALQALAGVAALTSGDSNLNMDVSVSVGDSFTHDFDIITSDNSIILQSAEPPTDGGVLTIKATGQGVAIVQVNVKYNVYSVGSKPDLRLNVVTTNKDDGTVEVQMCNAWTSKKTSGMVVTEMGLLSGHQAIAPKNLIGQVKNLKRVETTEQKVVLYFDEIAENEEAICFMVASKPVEKIINPQPVQIYSFPYYFPDKRVVGSYSMPQAMASSMCDECAECCEDGYIAGGTTTVHCLATVAMAITAIISIAMAADALY